MISLSTIFFLVIVVLILTHLYCLNRIGQILIKRHSDWLKSKNIKVPLKFNVFFIQNWETEVFILNLYKLIFKKVDFVDDEFNKLRLFIWLNVIIVAIIPYFMFYLKSRNLI
jgi:hypothetical protein